jgi:O-antigen ligase/Flp pilus assembly protein TadD
MVPGLFRPAEAPQTAFLEVAAGTLLAVALFRGEVSPRDAVRGPAARPFVLLVLWCALSLLWAHTLREGLPEAVRWTSVLVVLVLVRSLVRRRADAVRLLGAVFVAGAATATLGLLQFYFKVDWVPQAFPPAATFMNRNLAVSFVVAAWPLGLIVAQHGAPRVRLAVGVSSGLMLAYLFHTFTKSGWLALVVQGLLMAGLAAAGRRGRVPLPRPSWPALASALLVAAGLAQLTAEGFRPRLREAAASVTRTWAESPPLATDAPVPPLTSTARANSIRGRRAIWLNTAAMVREHPLLGVGLGNHKVEYPPYARRVAVDPGFGVFAQLDYVHNDALQLLAELGLVGGLLAAWCLLVVLGLFRDAWSSGREPALTLAVALSLAGLATDALFNFPFQRPIPPFVVAAELGVLAWIASPEATGAARGPRPSRAVAGLAAALTLVVAVWQARTLIADRRVLVARQAAGRADWVGAQHAAANALRVDRGRKEALFLAAQSALELGDAAASSALSRELLAAYPHDLPTLGNLAIAQRAQRQVPEARATFERLLALGPEDHRAETMLAQILEEEGDLEGAVRHFGRAAALDPADALAAFRQGVAALRMRDLATAEAALRMAVARGPTFAQAHKALGVCLVEQGRRQDALPFLRRALALDPTQADAARLRRLVEENGG